MVFGIVGARDGDIALILKSIRILSTRFIAGIRFYLGKFGRNRVIVCRSGVGTANGAIASQILIDRFRVRRIIGTGIAGSLVPEVKVGDVVISTKVQQHDVDFTALGYAPGVIPGMRRSVFLADPALIAAGYRGATKVGLRAFRGKVLSGDQFIAKRARAKYIRKVFGGLCVESGGAGAIGQAAYLNKVKYVAVRGISDRAGRPLPQGFARNQRKAERASQRVVLKLVTCLADS